MFSLFDRVVLFLIVLNFYNSVAAGDDLKDDNIDNKRSDSGGIWFGPRLGKRALTLVPEENRPPFLRLLEAADALKYYYDQLQYGNYEMQADDPGMKVSKKVIFTPKLGRSLSDDKRYDIDFRPRLGRRLTNDMPATPSDQDPHHTKRERFESLFTPRVGKRLSEEFLASLSDSRGLSIDEKRYDSVLFTPRVGKSLSDDVRDPRKTGDKRRENLLFTPRVGRSQSDDFSRDEDAYRVEADQMANRMKYFSPRLGRTMNFSPRLGRELTYDIYPDQVRVARSANKTKST